jgi:hypothetical protein
MFVDGLRYLTLDLGKYSDPQCGINLSIFPAPGSVDRSSASRFATSIESEGSEDHV